MSISPPPLVSIVTPTKNRSSLLRETILSIISQTYTNWEMLIIDDFSTDNTVEMLKEFSSEKRIAYHQRKGETGGAQVCRNIGIELAQGEYVILIDSDDLLTKTCIENRVKFISGNKNLDFAAFPTILFGWEFPDYDTYWNIPNNEDDICRFLNWDPTWGIVSVIWKTKSLIAIGKFDEKVLSFQDIDIHLRALIKDLNYNHASCEADSFVREHDEERIGIHCAKPKHLYSHERLLTQLYEELTKSSKLTEDRMISLAGFYFRVCNFWIQQNDLKRALQLWKNVAELKLATHFIYYSSIAYFNYLSLNKKELIPLFSRIRFIFYKILPEAFFLKNNTWKKLKKK
jgi:glycosyltransferase involved in cell wall biosynthesis